MNHDIQKALDQSTGAITELPVNYYLSYNFEKMVQEFKVFEETLLKKRSTWSGIKSSFKNGLYTLMSATEEKSTEHDTQHEDKDIKKSIVQFDFHKTQLLLENAQLNQHMLSLEQNKKDLTFLLSNVLQNQQTRPEPKTKFIHGNKSSSKDKPVMPKSDFNLDQGTLEIYSKLLQQTQNLNMAITAVNLATEKNVQMVNMLNELLNVSVSAKTVNDIVSSLTKVKVH